MCHFWGLNSWELLVASPRPQSFWSRPRSPLKQSHRSGPHCVACLLCPFLFMATLWGEMLRLSHFTGGNGGSERLSSLPGTHSWETEPGLEPPATASPKAHVCGPQGLAFSPLSSGALGCRLLRPGGASRALTPPSPLPSPTGFLLRPGQGERNFLCLHVVRKGGSSWAWLDENNSFAPSAPSGHPIKEIPGFLPKTEAWRCAFLKGGEGLAWL